MKTLVLREQVEAAGSDDPEYRARAAKRILGNRSWSKRYDAIEETHTVAGVMVSASDVAVLAKRRMKLRGAAC